MGHHKGLAGGVFQYEGAAHAFFARGRVVELAGSSLEQGTSMDLESFCRAAMMAAVRD
jgi:hypothetical protein